jgi:hypothetical protein
MKYINSADSLCTFRHRSTRPAVHLTSLDRILTANPPANLKVKLGKLCHYPARSRSTSSLAVYQRPINFDITPESKSADPSLILALPATIRDQRTCESPSLNQDKLSGQLTQAIESSIDIAPPKTLIPGSGGRGKGGEQCEGILIAQGTTSWFTVPTKRQHSP